VILGVVVLLGSTVSALRRNFDNIGLLVAGATCLFVVLDLSFGIVQFTVTDLLGRNMTFTDRVPLWNALLELGLKRPLLGYGYGGFWTAERVSYTDGFFQGHNGYLEVFVQGGFVGIALLGVLLTTVFKSIQRTGLRDYEFAVLRFTFFAAILLANVTESSFASERDLLTFVFYIIALNPNAPMRQQNSHIGLPARRKAEHHAVG